MSEALLALAAITFLAVLALLLRRAPTPTPEPRLLELAAQLPTQLARIDARSEALDAHVQASLATMQAELASLRREASADAHGHRETSAAAAAALRDEITRIVTHLGQTLSAHFAEFRTHSTESLGSHRVETAATDAQLRATLRQDLDAIHGKLAHFISETGQQQLAARDQLHSRLNDLGTAQNVHQEKMRATVEERLNQLNTTNAGKLEEMRATVDEKLHATLHTRLTESFGQVTDQLSKVHSGLGEMSKLSEGVDDLSRIFTNVKSRGGFAEVQLGMLLSQMLAPSQFVKNARVKPHTQEVVEFAVRFPGNAGETLLPIDAKFPREDWERLEHAYTEGSAEEIASAGRAFEAAIRTEGKRICEKYIEPPVTTPHAIMFLPTEGLYAEVMRREGLQAEIQTKCHVTIAGPSTLSAILTSFQMGFHMLAIQEKGDEVWKVLASTRSEFGKFEVLMGKMEKQVGSVQNTINDLGVRTRAINRTLREVGELDAPTSNGTLLSFDDAGLVPVLAATHDER